MNRSVPAGLVILTCWSAGVVAAAVLEPARPVEMAALLLAVGAAAAAVVARPAWIALALAATLLGVVRAGVGAADPGLAALAATWAGRPVTLSGLVVDDARGAAVGYEVLVQPEPTGRAGPAGARPPGNLLVRVRNGVPPAPGDSVQVSGRLRLPADRPGFDRRAYLAQRHALLELSGASLQITRHGEGPAALPALLREHYRSALADLLPAPHAAVLTGIVLGIRSGVPPALERDLVATGLVHLLVLSGLKVAVFARLVTAGLAPVLGPWAAFPALSLIVLYALAGGATPAALRAAAMGGLVILAGTLGRPTHVWTSLAVTAAAMLAWRPELSWDVGFQLSFAGTAAIILLTPGFEHRLGRLPGWFREPFAVTCAAQVGTLPMMAADFHLLSPVGPLANALVLPLLPVMVAGGLLVAPLAAIPALGEIAVLPLAALLEYLEQVAGWLARVPAASLPVPAFPPWAGAAYYLALAGSMGAARSSGRARRAALLVAALGPLLIGGAEVVLWARPVPEAAILAVGDGQAVLLRGPGGWVLIDGGPSPTRLADGVGARLPPWQRRLQGLILTGPGAGHSGGLDGLAYPATEVIVPSGVGEGAAWRRAVFRQVALGARTREVAAGDTWWLAGLRFEVLAPEPRAPDPGQLALRVAGPSGRSLCDLADLDPEAQVQAARRLRGGCDYLLLPDSGRSTPVPELLAAARPGRLLVSDGGGRLARGLPLALLSRTSEEGVIVLPL